MDLFESIKMRMSQEDDSIYGELVLLKTNDTIGLVKTGDTSGYNGENPYYESTSPCEFWVRFNGVDHFVNFNHDMGLIANVDFSEIAPEEKHIYAQRFYVDRPQTLITAPLNVASYPTCIK